MLQGVLEFLQRFVAAEQSVAKVADAKLDDAQAKRSAAATELAQADRVEQLAEAEKRARKSDGKDDA